MAKIPKKGKLYYRGRTTNPKTFKEKSKDLRRLIGYCYQCGCCLRGRTAIPAPDPYQADINNDDTPVVQCESCETQSAQDI